jgi:hypothetical protein
VHAKLTPITVLDVLEINEKFVDNDEIRSNGSAEIVDENESPEKNEISTPIRRKKRALWSQVFIHSSVLETIFEDTASLYIRSKKSAGKTLNNTYFSESK